MGNYFICNANQQINTNIILRTKSFESLLKALEPIQEIELIPYYKKRTNIDETYIDYKKRIRNIYIVEYNKKIKY